MIHGTLIHIAHTLRANLPYSILVFALAAGLIATLTLFLSVKREIRADAARSNARLDQLAQKLEQARCEVSGGAVAETGLAASSVSVTPMNVSLSGMNLGKRVQAMRMLRRNHDIAHVAAAVGVTRQEVELLIRVQRAGSTPAAAIRTAAS